MLGYGHKAAIPLISIPHNPNLFNPTFSFLRGSCLFYLLSHSSSHQSFVSPVTHTPFVTTAQTRSWSGEEETAVCSRGVRMHRLSLRLSWVSSDCTACPDCTGPHHSGTYNGPPFLPSSVSQSQQAVRLSVVAAAPVSWGLMFAGRPQGSWLWQDPPCTEHCIDVEQNGPLSPGVTITGLHRACLCSVGPGQTVATQSFPSTEHSLFTNPCGT